VALERVASGLRDVAGRHGGSALGALASPHATLEEARAPRTADARLDSDNVDYRLRQADFRGDRPAARWLGMPIAGLGSLDRVLVVGSFLRNDIRWSPSDCARRRSAARGCSSSVRSTTIG